MKQIATDFWRVITEVGQRQRNADDLRAYYRDEFGIEVNPSTFNVDILRSF